ncbi:MAG: hypothetical protein J0I99_19800 [Devosia sp.]|uniref:hypothetical protein n=1 Tax=Devosia sp. TaxID=1871048 RepID=UPI001AD429F0|nr:hypothetical protein [Devosia sp.]MBN9317991.1 hypothetical protein [Devosia sp.]
MALRLLAIDAASKFGWAFGSTDQMPVSGNARFADPGSEHEAYFAGAWRWMHDTIREYRPQAICMEAPLHLGKNTTAKTTELLNGIQACLRCNARQNSVFRVKVINQSTVRAFFIPRTPVKRGEKRPRLDSEQLKMLARKRCIELGFIDQSVTSLDQTDALAVWAWGVHFYDPENAKRFSQLRAA